MVFELTSEIKKKIDKAMVVSFDVFDTLLFRIVNSPEVIFDLVGKKYNIDGYRELRMRYQRLASDSVQLNYGFSHANIDEIYESIRTGEHSADVDWDAVKKYEIELERQSLVANDDIREIYNYAISIGKRVIAVTDMYLSADFIRECLGKNGFSGIETVYCSADERKTKYEKRLFIEVKNRENVEFSDIFHIGDNIDSDVAIPASLGIRTFHYKKDFDENRFDGAESSCIDEGVIKVLIDSQRSFWYNLGIEAGGPIYMGLIQRMTGLLPDKNARIFFLSRDGYNLCNILKRLGYKNVKYLYTSRRALLFAGIVNMDDEDISLLPPYTVGKTVGDILKFLCVDSKKVSFRKAGFDSVDSTVETNEDIIRFKQLYTIDRDIFLERARTERENAYRYFSKMGVFDKDAYMFDCGWNGTSQYLLERFKKSVGEKTENKFFYFGLFDDVKRRRQLNGLSYDCFLDDYLTNSCVKNHEAVYEVFFSAPHNVVHFYDTKGPCFESDTATEGRGDLFKGISDYFDMAYSYAASNNIEYSCSVSIGHLQEIIVNPTDEEAVNIGNLGSVNSKDDYGKKTRRIAYITKQDYEEDKNTPIYWAEGFFKRKDIDESLKILVAKDRNIDYNPGKRVIYSLESQYDLENYYYWMDCQKEDFDDCIQLEYYPIFSVVMPVYNTASSQLSEAICSVLNQTYPFFELILVDDNSSWTSVREVLKGYENHKKVKVIYRQENVHISECTNTGLDEAEGEYVVFMDCDDIIETNALYEFAKAINNDRELDFLYSDSDKITEDGLIRHNPLFKPDWSPDLFLSITYINHLAAYRTEIVKKLGGFRSVTDGAQDVDLTLRFMEASDNKRVGHVAKILYHWRERKESIAYSLSSKKYVIDAEKRAKEDALIRRGINGYLEYVPVISRYRTVLYPIGKPKVSIFIILSSYKNALDRCKSSVVEHTQYRNYEIIEVPNASDIDEAIDCADGDYFAFVDDSIEIAQDDWLDRMVGHAELKHVGAVGAKLLFPNSTYIFHSGISKTENGLSYDFSHCDDSFGHYVGFNLVDRDCLLVPGLCMVIERKKLFEIGKFNKSLANSVRYFDLCNRLFEHGFYNVVKDDVRIYCHYLSTTKLPEVDCISADPFLNPNLISLGNRLDLKVKPRIIKHITIDELDIDTCDCRGSGEVEIVDKGKQMRISGWSSLDYSDSEYIASRHLIISDINNNQYAVNLTSVPRIDIFEKYGHDVCHIDDGFITTIEKFDFGCKLNDCTFGVLTQMADGGKCYTHLTVIDGEEDRDIKKILSFCKGKRKIYVYGAGNYGNRCVNQLMSLGIPVEKVIVTKINNNVISIGGVEVVPLEMIENIECKDEVGFFVATKALFREQIIPLLRSKGFTNILGYPLDIY